MLGLFQAQLRCVLEEGACETGGVILDGFPSRAALMMILSSTSVTFMTWFSS